MNDKSLSLKFQRFYDWLSLYPWLNYWFPIIFIAGLIFYLSSKFTLPQPPFYIPYLDKIEHTIIYGALGFFARRAFRQTGISFLSELPGICAILFCMFYGFSDEIHQSFVPNRDTDIYDVLFDTIGGLLGQWIHFSGFVNKLFKYILWVR